MSQTMLIIDDDNAVLTSCQRIFSEEGFSVTTTTNSMEGLDLAIRKPYTVILCDWQMPGLNGMDVVEALETRAPQSAVVMISGYPSVGRATEAMKRGALDYLAKPFTPQEILATVQKAMVARLNREKATLGRFEKILERFPTQGADDKGPKSIAETVAETVGVAKATSPWLSLFVLGIMAGAYIGFGGAFQRLGHLRHGAHLRPRHEKARHRGCLQHRTDAGGHRRGRAVHRQQPHGLQRHHRPGDLAKGPGQMGGWSTRLTSSARYCWPCCSISPVSGKPAPWAP